MKKKEAMEKKKVDVPSQPPQELLRFLDLVRIF